MSRVAPIRVLLGTVLLSMNTLTSARDAALVTSALQRWDRRFAADELVCPMRLSAHHPYWPPPISTSERLRS